MCHAQCNKLHINVSRGRGANWLGEEGKHVRPCWLLPPSPEERPTPASKPAFMGTGAAPLKVLITNGTAGSQTACACLGPPIRPHRSRHSGISFSLSHVFAFAMGTFLVNAIVILVCPRNKLLKGMEVRPTSSGK